MSKLGEATSNEYKTTTVGDTTAKKTYFDSRKDSCISDINNTRSYQSARNISKNNKKEIVSVEKLGEKTKGIVAGTNSYSTAEDLKEGELMYSNTINEEGFKNKTITVNLRIKTNP